MRDDKDFTAMLGAPDYKILLGMAALHLAALNQPKIDLKPYADFLSHLASRVPDRTADSAEGRLAALRHVLVEEEKFEGSREDYDDIANANLIRVIDRKRGMPIALAILYIETARRIGWDVEGLNFPGHFLIRINHGADRLLADPFNDGAVLQAPDLRAIVKAQLGPQAELSATYYEPCTDRQILLRLQNNIKARLVRDGDYLGAIGIIETMRLIAPADHRPLFDMAVLYARTDQREQAKMTLHSYLDLEVSGRDRQDAVALLRYLETTR